MKKKTVCNCWFDSKHWKLGAHSVSLFSPWLTPPWGALLPLTFPDFTSLCQPPGSGETWACMPRRLEVTSTDIHITVHTWVLTREDRKCGASAPPAAFHRSSVLPRLLRLPPRVGEESSLSTQASKLCWPLTPWRFTHLDATVCSCRQITLGDGRNAWLQIRKVCAVFCGLKRLWIIYWQSICEQSSACFCHLTQQKHNPLLLPFSL